MLFGKKKSASAPKIVNEDLAARAFAKAVTDGDFVNFRLLFLAFSPARVASSERFEDAKYSYLLPDDESQSNGEFRRALALVREDATWRHIQRELDANRPAQLPAELVMLLADNAVRLGKFTIAAQAYELLRVRRRMQDEFFAQADAALDDGNVRRAVHGYLVATGLEYNYAAFPEPLPVVPDWQTKALMLHGEYPRSAEDCIPLQQPEQFIRTALAYLLLDAAAAARLEPRPISVRLSFLAELVKQRDPAWRDFVHRYRDACGLMRDFEARIQHAVAERGGGRVSLAREIEELVGEDPHKVPAALLGRTIDDGEWWQYLKELA
ncbi:MAG: hypothetical protein FJY92_00830, partial [Candidatus Hydrogenedentes bacterium]|nr:hypothetical protein [Candidatus Hydrogenedentota bacterium]